MAGDGDNGDNVAGGDTLPISTASATTRTIYQGLDQLDGGKDTGSQAAPSTPTVYSAVSSVAQGIKEVASSVVASAKNLSGTPASAEGDAEKSTGNGTN